MTAVSVGSMPCGVDSRRLSKIRSKRGRESAAFPFLRFAGTIGLQSRRLRQFSAVPEIRLIVKRICSKFEIETVTSRMVVTQES